MRRRRAPPRPPRIQAEPCVHVGKSKSKNTHVGFVNQVTLHVHFIGAHEVDRITKSDKLYSKACRIRTATRVRPCLVASLDPDGRRNLQAR